MPAEQGGVAQQGRHHSPIARPENEGPVNAAVSPHGAISYPLCIGGIHRILCEYSRSLETGLSPRGSAQCGWYEHREAPEAGTTPPEGDQAAGAGGDLRALAGASGREHQEHWRVRLVGIACVLDGVVVQPIASVLGTLFHPAPRKSFERDAARSGCSRAR